MLLFYKFHLSINSDAITTAGNMHHFVCDKLTDWRTFNVRLTGYLDQIPPKPEFGDEGWHR